MGRVIVKRKKDSFIQKKPENIELENVNGVMMRKDRNNNYVEVDKNGTILNIKGDNPNNLEKGDNIYDI